MNGIDPKAFGNELLTRLLTFSLPEQAERPDDPGLAMRPSRAERDAASRAWSALTTTTAIMPAVRHNG